MSSSDKSAIVYATYMADPLTADKQHQEGILRVSRRLDSCGVFPPTGGEYGYRLLQQEFSAEAGRVVDFMLRVMPQGLTDAIFGELARRKATILHVAEKRGDFEIFLESASEREGKKLSSESTLSNEAMRLDMFELRNVRTMERLEMPSEPLLSGETMGWAVLKLRNARVLETGEMQVTFEDGTSAEAPVFRTAKKGDLWAVKCSSCPPLALGKVEELVGDWRLFRARRYGCCGRMLERKTVYSYHNPPPI